MDTVTRVSLGEGTLYEAEIAGITKGEKGNPGEISGVITYLDQYKLGSVDENTDVGIYGKLQRAPEESQENEYYPISLKQNIQKGEAVIVSSVSGERKEYQITITDLDYNSANKGILFQVIDPELLDLTGGVIQGMSGSPIIQDGKVIGAVTHVFVQDASKGYGIFIENMLKHWENNTRNRSRKSARRLCQFLAMSAPFCIFMNHDQAERIVLFEYERSFTGYNADSTLANLSGRFIILQMQASVIAIR